MGRLDIRKESTQFFVALQELVSKGKDIPYEQAKKLLDKYNSFHSRVMEEEPTFSFEDHLAKRQRDKELRPDLVPNTVYAYLVNKDILTVGQLAKLLGTSSQTISARVKRGEEEIGIVRINVPKTNLDDMKPTETFIGTLNALQEIVNTKDKNIKLNDKIAAIKVILDYLSVEVINELKKKHQMADALINLILNVLIPTANKRIRGIVRDIQDRAIKGEDIDDLNIDLRVIFKELLPPDLGMALQGKGYLCLL